MTEKLILTAGPSITEREISYVTDAVRNGWNENWNGYIKRFEDAFRKCIGVPHAMATSSCTGAMHLALAALGIGQGDEVIVPDVTWIATAAVVVYTGATPVFCDIEEVSWCMNPMSLEARITPRTKAIIPAHLYGHPANMPAIMKIAERHGLYVIEDAAPSIGAETAGKKTGSFGHAAGFSFQGAKLMVTGEGGMLVANDGDIFAKAQKLGDHGRDPAKILWNTEIGYKYKMSNLQAALGLAQLERIVELIAHKRQINARYFRNLNGSKSVTVSTEKPGSRSIHWMTSIEVHDCSGERRVQIMAGLKKLGVDSRPVFYPLSSMPMFKRADNPVSYRVGCSAINLPSGHNLTEDEIDYVSECVLKVCGG